MALKRLELHGEGAGSMGHGTSLAGPDATTFPAGRTLRAVKLLIATLSCFGTVGCSPDQAPLRDDERLVLATLQLLTAPGIAVCVDADTAGRPLAVFRMMSSNPSQGVKPLAWFVPAALKPPSGPSNSELFRGGQADSAVHIDQPANSTPPLRPELQVALNRAAWILSARETDQDVKITPAWAVPGVKARWWLRNRISSHCTPNYQISDPVVAGRLGFVTVTGDHWGTTYAFTRHGADWIARAQWSNWLY